MIIISGYRNIAGSYLTAHISLTVLESSWKVWISSLPQWFVNIDIRAGLLDCFECTWLMSALESLYVRVCEVNLDALNTTDTTTCDITFRLLSWEVPDISIEPSTQPPLVTVFYMQVFYKGNFHSYQFHRTLTCLFTFLESGQPPALPDMGAVQLCCLSFKTENHFGVSLHHLILMLTLTLWFTLYPEIPCSASSKYNTTQLSTNNCIFSWLKTTLGWSRKVLGPQYNSTWCFSSSLLIFSYSWNNFWSKFWTRPILKPQGLKELFFEQQFTP